MLSPKPEVQPLTKKTFSRCPDMVTGATEDGVDMKKVLYCVVDTSNGPIIRQRLKGRT